MTKSEMKSIVWEHFSFIGSDHRKFMVDAFIASVDGKAITALELNVLLNVWDDEQVETEDM